MADLWQRVCLDKRRKRKPLTKLGLLQDSIPMGGPGASTQTMRNRSDMWDLEQETSACEAIWKFLSNGCAAGFVKLLEFSSDFSPYIQIHLRVSNLPCLSPQSPLSTAGFCLSPHYCLPGQHVLWGVGCQCTCPISNRTNNSSFSL